MMKLINNRLVTQYHLDEMVMNPFRFNQRSCVIEFDSNPRNTQPSNLLREDLSTIIVLPDERESPTKRK